ncbi:hypothetical protein PF023_01415 [Enterococcus thailandicus]|uniref:hypothetical protein n=1 Tax=Enterococcus thailandicus TaxID=417368 RepID=UPI0022EBE0B9|nr:hypothetical protein [Enterococcus thailandicus]MDA3972690.1 hypothetical protein [Enterococcus thailandicus]MDA3975186.1 hypothetical protein [Enterococcus thailandicus]MDA3980150.1 hypothetical protein [Enterococcus thailandicus]
MKKKICFVLAVDGGLTYSTLPVSLRNEQHLKEFFSKDYDVSLNYLRDKEQVDYLIVPKQLPPFINEKNLPIIEVPSNLFVIKDYQGIKEIIDHYLDQEFN